MFPPPPLTPPEDDVDNNNENGDGTVWYSSYNSIIVFQCKKLS
jgi:hypothetical protein